MLQRQYYLAISGLPLWVKRQQSQYTEPLEAMLPFGQSLDNLCIPGQAKTGCIINPLPSATCNARQTSAEPLVANTPKPVPTLTDSQPRPATGAVDIPEPSVSQSTPQLRQISANKNKHQQTEPTTSPRIVTQSSAQAQTEKPDKLSNLREQIVQCDFCHHRYHGKHALWTRHIHEGASFFQTTNAKTRKTKNREKKPADTQSTHGAILLLTEQPVAHEFYRQKLCTDSYDYLFQGLFRSLRLTRDVYLGTVLKCFTYPKAEDDPPNAHRLQSQIQHCAQFLQQEISTLPIDFIVLLGYSPAIWQLMDIPINTDTEQGTNNKAQRYQCETMQDYFEWQFKQTQLPRYQDIPVALGYHPGMLCRFPHLKADAWRHWQKIYHYL